MSEILLDSTLGELEILEFVVKGVHFGINVAKVQEIVINKKITSIPLAARGVRGMFLIRDDIYTVMDLNTILFGNDSDINEKTLYILCNFNKQHNAFVVDSVIGIKRISWSEMLKPDKLVNTLDRGGIVGIVKNDENIISILDFEKIVSDINPSSALKKYEPNNDDINKKKLRSKYNILIADDSKMLNAMLTDNVKKAGYNTISVEDGKEAYETLIKDISKFDLMVTDIEMPLMDGLECSRLIKEKYPNFPIIVFSSLANESLTRKIEKLKLQGCITKPEIRELADRIDKILMK